MRYSEPLPASIVGGPQGLSPESRKRIMQLSRPEPVRFIAKAIVSWLIVAATITVAVLADNLLVTLLAIVVIAGRLNTFALLTHEQTHYTGLKTRWGDILTDLFVSYPLLFLSVGNYSRVHLAHHKFYFSDQDPDLSRKSGKDWDFPMAGRRLASLFLRDFFGLSVIRFIRGKNKKVTVVKTKRLGPSHDAWLKPLYLGSWAVVFTLTGTWHIFLIYWLVPIVTLFQVFVRIGATCEHVYIADQPLGTSTATIIPAWWESLLFPHLNFFYHVYHHYFPGVPYARLPEVHALFVKDGLVKEEYVFNGITRYFVFLMSQRRRNDLAAALD